MDGHRVRCATHPVNRNCPNQVPDFTTVRTPSVCMKPGAVHVGGLWHGCAIIGNQARVAQPPVPHARPCQPCD
jgi:hypothetical protein